MSYTFDQTLVVAYYEGARFQIDLLKQRQWKRFTLNFCREYARGKYGLGASNTRSPQILRKVCEEYPDAKPYIKPLLVTLKDAD